MTRISIFFRQNDVLKGLPEFQFTIYIYIYIYGKDIWNVLIGSWAVYISCISQAEHYSLLSVACTELDVQNEEFLLAWC